MRAARIWKAIESIEDIDEFEIRASRYSHWLECEKCQKVLVEIETEKMDGSWDFVEECRDWIMESVLK